CSNWTRNSFAIKGLHMKSRIPRGLESCFLGILLRADRPRLLLLLLTLTTGCRPNSPLATFEKSPLFEHVTEESGVRFTYRNGEEADRLAILESLGGGVGVLDFDGDGLPDLFFPGAGYFEAKEVRANPPKLYRNL